MRWNKYADTCTKITSPLRAHFLRFYITQFCTVMVCLGEAELQTETTSLNSSRITILLCWLRSEIGAYVLGFDVMG